MRRTICVYGLAGLAAVANPAHAEGPYVGVEGGATFQHRLAYDFVGLSNFFSTKYAVGAEVAGKMGYDFEGVRVEAELGYKRARADRFGFQIDGSPLAVQRGAAVSGNVHSFSGMINGYWDITQKRFRPYVGGGIGVARITSDHVGYAGFGDSGVFLNATDTAFAYQLMAGVKTRLTRQLSAHVGYRYFSADNFRLPAYDTVAKSALHSSSVLGGISYSFGHSIADDPLPPRPPIVAPAIDRPDRPPVPPEGVVGPVAEPGAPAPRAADGAVALTPISPPGPVAETSTAISFATRQADLSAQARAVLDRAALAYRRTGRMTIIVTGDAPDDGPAVYDETLARQRATAAKTYLARRGVAPGLVSLQPFDVETLDPGSTAGGGTGPAAGILIGFGLGSGR